MMDSEVFCNVCHGSWDTPEDVCCQECYKKTNKLLCYSGGESGVHVCTKKCLKEWHKGFTTVKVEIDLDE